MTREHLHAKKAARTRTVEQFGIASLPETNKSKEKHPQGNMGRRELFQGSAGGDEGGCRAPSS
jgi:hypothetical protein